MYFEWFGIYCTFGKEEWEYKEVKDLLSNIELVNNQGGYFLNAENIRIFTSKDNEFITHIGEKNRVIARENKIKEIKNQINVINQENHKLNDELFEENSKIDLLEKNIRNKPNLDKYNIKESEFNKINIEINSLNNKAKEINQNIFDINKNITKKESELDDRLEKNELDLLRKKEIIKDFSHLQKQCKGLNEDITYKNKEILNKEEELVNLNNKYNSNKNLFEEKNNKINIIDNEIKRGNEDILTKTNKIHLCENELEKLETNFNQLLQEIGAIKSNISSTSHSIEILSNDLKIKQETKNIKNQILKEYKIPKDINNKENLNPIRLQGKINKNRYLLLELENIEYDVNIESLKVEFTEDDNYKIKEITNLISKIQTISYINKFSNKYEDKETAIKNITTSIRRNTDLVNEKIDEIYTVFFADGLLYPLSKIINKAKILSQEFIDQLEKEARPDKMSFFAEFKEDGSDARTRSIRKMLTGKLELKNKYRDDFISELIRIVEFELENNNYEDDIDIVNTLFEKINYKNYYKFELLFRRANSDKISKLTKKELAGFSGGESVLAYFYYLLIIIKADMEKAKFKDTMPKFIILDEGFERVDGKNAEKLETIMYDIFNIYMVTSYQYFVKFNCTVNYINLINTVIDGKSMILQYPKLSAIRKEKYSV